MIVDEKSRQRLLQRQQDRKINHILASLEVVKSVPAEISSPLQKIQKHADSQVSANASLLRATQKVGTDLENNFKKIPLVQILDFFQSLEDKLVKIVETVIQPIKFPDIFNIKGNVNVESLPPVTLDKTSTVKVTALPDIKGEVNVKTLPIVQLHKEAAVKVNSLPDVKVSNLSELSTKFETIIAGLQVALYKTVGGLKLNVPDKVTVSKPVEIKNWSDLVEGFEELKKGFNILINQEKTGKGESDKPMEVEVKNFPPQLTPQPVTKIDINPLRGEVTTTGVTVTNVLTKLPPESLARRRSIIVFNNAGATTLYIGGANVTASGTGIGLPVLPQTYSPTIDAGPGMILYGIVSVGPLTAITLEVSNDYSQGGGLP